MDDSPSRSDDISKADAYRHADGTLEVVFAVDNGQVLTVREYGDVDSFEDAVADATYCGEHEEVASLPHPLERSEDPSDPTSE